MYLDVSDFKESDNHKLLHLVWRKFPSNRCPTDGQKTTISDSTPTDEGSRPGVLKISKNSLSSDKDCLSATDMRGLFDANESASNFDSGSTSDGSLHSTDLAALERTSFTFPAKGQSSKPKTLEITKSKINLSNRFGCLKDFIPTNNDTSEVSGLKSSPPSPRIFFGGKRSRGTDSRQITTKTTSGSESSLVSPTYCGEISHSMKEVIPGCSNDTVDNRKRHVGSVDILDPSKSYGSLFHSVGPDHRRRILFNKTDLHREIGLKVGDRVTYIFQPNNEYDQAKARDVRLIDNG